MLRTNLTAIVLLSLIAPLIPTPGVAAASTPNAQYSVGLTNGAVSVSLILNLLQNATLLSFEKSFTLPLVHVSAVGSNSTNLAQELQGALRSKNPKAQVNNLNLQVVSSSWSNKTATQWLNISLSFSVTGVSTTQGETARTDLSWKSFAVSSDYPVGNVEINRIGEKYLSGLAADMGVHSGSSSLIQIFYHVNGRPIDSTQFQSAVNNMTILDFSSFETPVSKWQQSQVSVTGETWSFTGGRGLGMVYTQEITEGGQLSTAAYGLFYDLTGTVTAPYGAQVAGDTVTFATGGFTEVAMVGIVFSTVVLWSGAFLFERRIQGKTGRKKTQR